MNEELSSAYQNSHEAPESAQGRKGSLSGSAPGGNKIVLVVHHAREEAARVARDLATRLEKAGAEVGVVGEGARILGRPDLEVAEESARVARLVVSVGGDGTALQALRAAEGVPVLAVNLGSLGFLATAEPREVLSATEAIAAGGYSVVERMGVAVTELKTGGRSSASQHEAPPVATNEVSIEKSSPHRLVEISVDVDGNRLAVFRADGVLVASPTGSTAYAFSVHGPLVDPSLEALLVVPVAPHGLFDRCVVLGPDAKVRLCVEGEREACLAIDGRKFAALPPGSHCVVTKSDRPVRFAYLGEPKAFVSKVSTKFGIVP